MKTITLPGFIHCKPCQWKEGNVIDGFEYLFWCFEDYGCMKG